MQDKVSTPTGGTSWEDWKLEERRSSNYTFTSMKELRRFFSNWLPIEEIDEIIGTAKVGFLERKGCSSEETKLQLVKKCEYKFVRLLKSRPE